MDWQRIDRDFEPGIHTFISGVFKREWVRGRVLPPWALILDTTSSSYYESDKNK
ncbi:MAG: hypothetical protein O6944_10410 [Gammaproteobacteria bacterium]|nr:hypothetical protein [Gammaproteobacteria bacterium]